MLKTIGKNHTSGAFSKFENDLVSISEFEFGPTKKSNFIVARVSSKHKDQKNLLGMDVLSDLSLIFDFKKEKLVVLSKTPSSPPAEVLFMDERNHPYVDLVFDEGVAASAIWDSGAGMTCVDESFALAHPKLFIKAGISTGSDSSGTFRKGQKYIMADFNLGGHHFPSTEVVVLDLSSPNSTVKRKMDVILGYPILKRANWLMDFRKRTWAIMEMI